MKDHLRGSGSWIYRDQPKPTLALQALLVLFLIGFLAAVPGILLAIFFPGAQTLVISVLILFSGVILYALWLLDHVQYTASEAGLKVEFGNLTRTFDWGDFVEISRKQGLFTLKIGWWCLTPCVRLRDAVVLRRSPGKLPLHITPSSTSEFIDLIKCRLPELFS